MTQKFPLRVHTEISLPNFRFQLVRPRRCSSRSTSCRHSREEFKLHCSNLSRCWSGIQRNCCRDRGRNKIWPLRWTMPLFTTPLKWAVNCEIRICRRTFPSWTQLRWSFPHQSESQEGPEWTAKQLPMPQEKWVFYCQHWTQVAAGGKMTVGIDILLLLGMRQDIPMWCMN